MLTYEQYWSIVIGSDCAERAVAEYDLKPGDDCGLDEWLGEAESMSRLPEGFGDTSEATEFHKLALRELSEAANEVPES